MSSDVGPPGPSLSSDSSHPETDMEVDQKPNDTDDQEASVHAHVMKLLSATVNASLSELGHFPGSGLVLQELRQQNQHFRDVTLKMHQDNATLQHVVDKQNRDIAALQNQVENFRREFRQLNEKLRKVIIERDNVVSYARIISQNAPPWQGQPIPQPIPYGMHPMQQFAPPPPVITGYYLPEQGAHPPQGVPPGHVMTTALIPAPVVPTQSASTATQALRHIDVIDLTANEDTDEGERDRKRPRRTPPEESKPYVPPTPHVELSQLGQQLSEIEKEMKPIPAQVQPQEQEQEQQQQPQGQGQEQPQPQTIGDDGDYDDYEEERDADGLVSIKTCLSIAYEERDGKTWCTMCQFRSLKAVTDEPPTPMPTNEEGDLVRHLEEVHPAGWKKLRTQ